MLTGGRLDLGTIQGMLKDGLGCRIILIPSSKENCEGAVFETHLSERHVVRMMVKRVPPTVEDWSPQNGFIWRTAKAVGATAVKREGNVAYYISGGPHLGTLGLRIPLSAFRP